MKIVLATKNPGKLAELKELASDAEWLELVLAPDDFDPKETGKTFYENAALKARAAAALTGLPAIADDSGLVVEALNGRPGIHSARYCEGSDADRRHKLLEEMKAVPNGKRDAAFMCSMVLCIPTGDILYSVVKAWTGRIGLEEKGTNGFGYDPIFCVSNQDKTAAELTPEEKNKVSHRGQAWRQMLTFLAQHESETRV